MNTQKKFKEVSIEEFIDAIQNLPNHEHREKWLRWLKGYEGPGPFNRQTGKKRSAKFAYNNLAYPEILLWLIRAAGGDGGLVDIAESDSGQFENARRRSAAIRKRVPWEDLERLLWE